LSNGLLHQREEVVIHAHQPALPATTTGIVRPILQTALLTRSLPYTQEDIERLLKVSLSCGYYSGRWASVLRQVGRARAGELRLVGHVPQHHRRIARAAGAQHAIHALADDISMQAMSRPYVLKEYNAQEGRLVFVDEKVRKAPVDLKVSAKTKFLTQQLDDIKAGGAFYCNMARTSSERTATELLDQPRFTNAAQSDYSLAKGSPAINAVLVRRSALARVRGFDPALRVQADLDFCLRLAASGAAGHGREPQQRCGERESEGPHQGRTRATTAMTSSSVMMWSCAFAAFKISATSVSSAGMLRCESQ
jgi:hypothetical protein